MKRKTLEEVKEEFFKRGLEPLFEEYYNNRQKLKARTKEGYLVEIKLNSLISGDNFRFFSKSNPYTIQNIKLYLKINEKGYTLLSNDYEGNKAKLKWLCDKGHEYEAGWNSFNNGYRCDYCAREVRARSRRKTHEEFVKEVYDLVKEEYQILGEYKNSQSKIEILHNICGKRYKPTPNEFLIGNRCPNCKKKSKGEEVISKWLNKNNIENKIQYRFKDCKDKYPLPFDFAIFNNDILLCVIEYDGIQHFKCSEHWGGEENLKNIQLKDKIKNEYCEKNNIPLIRIPYWEYDEIDYILDMQLQWLFLQIS